MNNKDFLSKFKLIYPSLNSFEIINNYLLFKSTKTYSFPLANINLSQLDKSLYTLSSKDIFQILYMIELLYRPTLEEHEIIFVKNYTKSYLVLQEKIRNSSITNDLYQYIWWVEYPIHLAYNDYFNNMVASNVIIELITNHNNSNLEKSPKLVLSKGNNPTFEMEEITDNYTNFKEAGFTTIFLITIPICLTLIFIAFFIVGR